SLKASRIIDATSPALLARKTIHGASYPAPALSVTETSRAESSMSGVEIVKVGASFWLSLPSVRSSGLWGGSATVSWSPQGSLAKGSLVIVVLLFLGYVFGAGAYKRHLVFVLYRDVLFGYFIDPNSSTVLEKQRQESTEPFKKVRHRPDTHRATVWNQNSWVLRIRLTSVNVIHFREQFTQRALPVLERIRIWADVPAPVRVREFDAINPQLDLSSGRRSGTPTWRV